MAVIGIRQGMLTQSGPAFLKEAHALGFQAVELDVGRDDRADALGGKAGRAAFRKAAKDTGIALPSLCLGCLNRVPLAGADDALRAEASATVRRAIGWANELGADVLLLAFFVDGEMKTADDRKRLVEEVSKLAPEAAQAGVKLGLESTLHATVLLEALKQIGAKNVGSYWDTGNSIWRGYDPVEEIGLLGKHIVRVHLKDTFKDPSDRMLGEGRVPWAQIPGALAAAGYRGPLILETPTKPGPIENAKRNLAFARKVFEGQAVQAGA